MKTLEQQLVADEILAQLRTGRTLTSICREAWAPSAPTVHDWLALDANFAENYAKARQIGYTLMSDEYVDAVRDTRMGTKRKRKYEVQRNEDGAPLVDAEGQPLMAMTEDTAESYDAVDRARLHADGLKWMLSKALPKIYGDKLQVEPPSVPGGGFTLTFQ